VIAAWDFTNAWDHADLILVADADDPQIRGYRNVADEMLHATPVGSWIPVTLVIVDEWVPMVHKLNIVAVNLAEQRRYRALGFAGDDHLPQTIGWAKRYLDVLDELGSGMVYGDDGYQGQNLSTEWAVTADVVRALGRMVPADVEHMYCDNSMMELFGGAGALRHLPEVRIEHMHPIAGKAENDAQYQRVNHRDQFKKDRTAYERWRGSGMVSDVATVRALRPGRPDVRPIREVARRMSPGSGPRKVPPRPRGTAVARRLPYPRHFRKVRGATPDEIMMTIADFAVQVPPDQEIVELGVFQGRTSLMLAWGARQGHGAHVTGIDAWDLDGNDYGPPFTDPGSHAWAKHNVMALGYNDRITLVRNFACDAAAVWDGPPVGLLFVDDDHSYAGARGAITSWAPNLAPGATIAVDDYGHPDWPGVKEAVDALVAEGVLEPIQIFHDHLAVTRLAVLAEAPTAITSEGVSPSPVGMYQVTESSYPAVGDQVAVPPIGGGTVAIGEAETIPLHQRHLHVVPDTQASTYGHHGDLTKVGLHDALSIEADIGTPIASLNLVLLKALAKARGIKLGVRKDKRDLIIQALTDGR
jgi:predicted O-methyltransferase YrrM